MQWGGGGGKLVSTAGIELWMLPLFRIKSGRVIVSIWDVSCGRISALDGCFVKKWGSGWGKCCCWVGYLPTSISWVIEKCKRMPGLRLEVFANNWGFGKMSGHTNFYFVATLKSNLL